MEYTNWWARFSKSFLGEIEVMEGQLKIFLEKMQVRPGASIEALKDLQEQSSFSLPVDYINFLTETNGAVGMLGSSYADFWPVENLIKYNDGYKVKDFLPSVFLIGSDGGNEAFGLDFREIEPTYTRKAR